MSPDEWKEFKQVLWKCHPRRCFHLTEWERNFINDMNGKKTEAGKGWRGLEFTMKQWKQLRKISERSAY